MAISINLAQDQWLEPSIELEIILQIKTPNLRTNNYIGKINQQ